MKKILTTAGAIAAAAALLCSSGCTGNTKWAFKTDTGEITNGMWIYYTYKATTDAFSKLNPDGSKAFGDIDFGDEKIDGQDAKDWIYAQAKKGAKEYLALEKLAADKNIKIDESMQEYFNDYYKQYYDHYNSTFNDLFTELGISSESYIKVDSYPNLVKQELFTKLYGKDGEFEVKDDELKKYFKENYISYYYISADLKTKDAEDNEVDIDEDTLAEYTQRFKKYANMINNGNKTTDDVTAQYKIDFEAENDPSTSDTVTKTSLSSSELDTLILETKEKTAVTKTIDNKMYLVYVFDINEKAETIPSIDAEKAEESTGIDRNSVLSTMKSDDFEKYIKAASDKLDYERNDACVHKYDADRTIKIIKDTIS